MPLFSISESLGFGWRTFRHHSGLMLGTTLILILVGLVERLFAGIETSSSAVAGIVCSGACLDAILGIGYIIIVLKLARSESARLRDLIPPGRLFWQSIVTSIGLGILMFVIIVLGILVGIGLGMLAGGSKDLESILTILGALVGAAAAIYVAVCYVLLRFVAIDSVRPMKEIFQKSAALSSGMRTRLFWLMVVLGLIDVVAAVTLIGLLVAAPVTSLALADVYLKLRARAPESPSPAHN
ncbi:MAG: hypothetical protein ACREGH_01920 [Minisyncoccia bacterium]